MGRPIEDEPELRERIIDFGSAGYVALYHYVPGGEQITILATRCHGRVVSHSWARPES